MALNDFETSVERGQPIELYQFIYGAAGQSFNYTDAEGIVTHDSMSFDPLPIRRGKIETKGKLSGRELEITVPITSEVADLFRIFPPGRVVSIIIRQGHLPNPDDPAEWASGENFPVVWSGSVLEAKRNDAQAVLNCEGSGSGMRRPGLRRHYQWSCPLVLYGPRCQANKVPVPGVVESIAGNGITLVAGWNTNPLSYYTGGLLEWDGDFGLESRGILRAAGETIFIAGPPIGMNVGDTVNAFIGCPHTLSGCEVRHNNVVNYGGHPWIPDGVNPVGKNNHT